MKPIEVLMVEDNLGDVVLMRTAIENVGLAYQLTVLSDGVEALEFLYQRGRYQHSPRPELILMDLQLPRKSGREVYDEIRSDPLFPAIPLVLMSSSKAELQSANAFPLAMAYYLEKPSTFQDFVAMMHTLERFRCRVMTTNDAGKTAPP